MMKLNYKGFTLVELLAVIAIMGMLAVIMVPTISGVIEENKTNNSENLKNSIKSSARAYISDNRYEIKLDDSSCDNNNTNTRDITSIGTGENLKEITNSNISVLILVSEGYLKSSSGEIIDPKTNKSIDKSNSYIKVTYDCSSKDFKYGEPHIE